MKIIITAITNLTMERFIPQKNTISGSCEKKSIFIVETLAEIYEQKKFQLQKNNFRFMQDFN